MDKLKVVLDWFPNTNHTGYLLAQKRGWFQEANLDVEIFPVLISQTDRLQIKGIGVALAV